MKRTTNIDIWNDKDFVLQNIKEDIDSFRYASDDLKNDKEVVKEAIKFRGENLQFASQELRNDNQFIKLAMGTYDFAKIFSDKVLIPEINYKAIFENVEKKLNSLAENLFEKDEDLKSEYNFLIEQYLEDCKTEIDYVPYGDNEVCGSSHYSEADIKDAEQYAKDDLADDALNLAKDLMIENFEDYNEWIKIEDFESELCPDIASAHYAIARKKIENYITEYRG